ncbi:hypothetical protein ACFQ9Y_08185 [Peribacillus simplex]
MEQPKAPLEQETEFNRDLLATKLRREKLESRELFFYMDGFCS